MRAAQGVHDIRQIFKVRSYHRALKWVERTYVVKRGTAFTAGEQITVLTFCLSSCFTSLFLVSESWLPCVSGHAPISPGKTRQRVMLFAVRYFTVWYCLGSLALTVLPLLAFLYSDSVRWLLEKRLIIVTWCFSFSFKPTDLLRLLLGHSPATRLQFGMAQQ